MAKKGTTHKKKSVINRSYGPIGDGYRRRTNRSGGSAMGGAKMIKTLKATLSIVLMMKSVFVLAVVAIFYFDVKMITFRNASCAIIASFNLSFLDVKTIVVCVIFDIIFIFVIAKFMEAITKKL